MSRNPPYAPWISHEKWWVYLEVYKFKMVTGSVGMSPWSMEVQTQISKCWFTCHIHLVVPKVTNPIFFSLNKKFTLLFAQLVIVYMSWWLGSSSNQPLIVTYYYYNKIWPKKKNYYNKRKKVLFMVRTPLVFISIQDSFQPIVSSPHRLQIQIWSVYDMIVIATPREWRRMEEKYHTKMKKKRFYYYYSWTWIDLSWL